MIKGTAHLAHEVEQAALSGALEAGQGPQRLALLHRQHQRAGGWCARGKGFSHAHAMDTLDTNKTR